MSEDVAIVGMACVLPQAANLQQYWANVVGGVDAITDIPPQRWQGIRNDQLPPDHEAHICCRRGGFIPAEILFDPMPYGVMPKAVQHGDPDQFLMLHLVDRALRDADIAPGDPSRRKTDVIVGRGGYPTAKFVEMAMRVEIIDVVLELIERRYPELLQGGWREKLDRYLRLTISPNDPDTISTAIPNLVASLTANRLDLCGAAYVVDAACASSLLAVEQALGRLRQRKAEVAVAAGLFVNHGPPFWQVFSQLGALSPSGVLRAFDRRADGLVVGEGGAAVVLRRLDDARRRGDRIYAILKGVGVSSDGRHTSVLAPSPVGQVEALKRAYADSGVDPASIGYLELHGTGTVLGDLTEIHSVKTFFGRSAEPPTARGMGSVKSMIGHLMPASGMAALVKTALALSNKILPPTLHCDEPHPELADAPFYLVTQTRPWVHSPARGPRRAGINTFGFGGINAHAILEEVPEPSTKLRNGVPRVACKQCRTASDEAVAHDPAMSSNAGRMKRRRRALRPRPLRLAVARGSELAVLSAASTEEMAGRLRRLLDYLDRDGSEATLVDVAATLAGEADFAQACKLAVVCKDLAGLRAELRRCREALQSGAVSTIATADVYFSAQAAVPPGKIALIFPGMDYAALNDEAPKHLLEFALHFPEVRSVLDCFEQRDGHAQDTVPTSAILSPPAGLPEEFQLRQRQRLVPRVPQAAGAPPPAAPLPQQRNLTAMVSGLANWAGWRCLERLEVPVELLVGQSFGEIAALCAAGAGNFEETGSAFWKLLDAAAWDDRGGRLAFALASQEQIAPLLAEHPGAYPAIYLSPTAMVFGGHGDAVAQVIKRLQASGIPAQILPYPPAHTPALAHLNQEILKIVHSEDHHTGRLRMPVYSSILADRYPHDPRGIEETLTLNLDHPVRLWQTLRKAYDDGARVFIQVAGGDVVGRLESMLPDGAEVVKAALAFHERDPLTQVHHVCAVLFAAGVPLRLCRLYEHCEVRLLAFDAPQPAAVPPRMAMPLRMHWSPLDQEAVPPRRVAEASRPADEAQTSAPADEQAANSATPDKETEEPALAESMHAPHQLRLTPLPELPPLPVLGEVVRLLPEEEVVIRRVLDLSEDLYLKDHLFIHATEVKPVEECLPILPLTFSMEFMAEAAALLAPELGLIGFEGVRASRWIGLADASTQELQIEARVRPDDARSDVRVVEASIGCQGKPCASATVLFAASYREDVRFEMADHRGDGPWPLQAAEVYSRRRMFHGPSLQNIAELKTLGDPVCSGELAVLPRDRLLASNPNPVLLMDPCLMDGLGQLFGLWCQVHEVYALPSQVEKVEFYRPSPAVGSRVPARVEVTHFDHELRQVRCNIEAEDGAGGVWARIVGWTDWIFPCPKPIADCLRLPHEYCLAEEVGLPGLPAGSVCALLSTATLQNTVMVDSIARTFLRRDELQQLEAIADAQQRRQVLCSRIALKDAARLWWARTYDEELPHPASFALGHDAAGRPCLQPGDDPRLPHVTLAHTDKAAIAIAASQPVGVDIEPASRPSMSLLGDFAAPDETILLDRLAAADPAQAWETRLWCAKEAAAKALGTGLQGRPKDFQAVEMDDSGSLQILHVPSGACFAVSTCLVGEFVVAQAAAAQEALVG
jgi:acyl transferase domain-containing protein/phosphopantetheinyl transferase